MNFNKSLILFSFLYLCFFIPIIQATTTQYAYVVCNNPDTNYTNLNVINGNYVPTGTPNPVITTIGSGSMNFSYGYAIAITPNGRYAYVAQLNNSTVYALDITTNSVIAAISTNIPSNPEALAITPDGNYVCVVGNGDMSVITVSSNTVTSGPTSLGIGIGVFIAMGTVGGVATAYVPDSFSNNVVPVTITGGVPTKGTAFAVGGGDLAAGLALTPNGSTLYVASNSDSKLYPVTNLGGTPIVGTGISIGTIPEQVVISSNGNTAYVANYSSGTVSVVNLSNQTLTTNITVGTHPSYLALTTDGSYLYVTNNGSSSVSVINTATNTVTSTVTVGSSPRGVAIVGKQSGTIDTTFGTAGYTVTPISRADILKGTALQSNDKIVIAGITQTTAPTAFLAQYTSSGSLDTGNFNSSGSTPGYQTLLPGTATQSSAQCVTTDASSNILIAGSAIVSSNTDFFVARYTSAGILDTTFNTTNLGWVTTSIGNGATVNGIGIQSAAQSSRIVVGGCSAQGSNPVFTLAGYVSSGGSAGTLDSTFGTSGVTTTSIGNVAIIRAIAVVPSTLNGATIDYIIAVGVVDNNITLARYTATGALDTSFGSSGIFQPSISGASSSQAYSTLIDATTNNIYIAGSANISGINQSLLMRCTPGGALDTSFNGSGYVLQSIPYGSEFYSLLLQTTSPINNNYIVTGGYAAGGLCNQLSLARYTTSGSFDIYWNNNSVSLTTIGTNAAANAIGIQSTGNSIAAGTGDGTFCISRFFE